MLVLALCCALLPLALVVFPMLFSSDSLLFNQEVANTVQTDLLNQFGLNARANAQRIEARLGRLEHSVRILSSTARQVLGHVDVFGAAPVPPGAGLAEEGEEEEGQASLSPEQIQPPFDSALYYADAEDGAIFKIVDSGSSGAFYPPPMPNSQHSDLNRQRLYATAALDPLLVKTKTAEPLCALCFILTDDNLLRTYPFLDFTGWTADKKLTETPMYAYRSDKANSGGVVWTAPYPSRVLEPTRWVVACLAPVTLGDQTVGVAGIEIDLATLSDELLEFSLGEGGTCWLVKPCPATTTEPNPHPEQWLVLAGQTGTRRVVNVTPYDRIEESTDEVDAVQIADDADMLAHGPAEMIEALRGNTSDAAMVSLSQTSDQLDDGSFLAAEPVTNAEWMLCGEANCPATAALADYQRGLEGSLVKRLSFGLGALLLGLVLAFGLTWFESRRLSRPLAILTQQVRQAGVSGKAASVAIADEGELGQLAGAVQQLVDISSRRSQAWQSPEVPQTQVVAPPAPSEGDEPPAFGTLDPEPATPEDEATENDPDAPEPEPDS